jgi:hypothetical protein
MAWVPAAFAPGGSARLWYLEPLQGCKVHTIGGVRPARRSDPVASGPRPPRFGRALCPLRTKSAPKSQPGRAPTPDSSTSCPADAPAGVATSGGPWLAAGPAWARSGWSGSRRTRRAAMYRARAVTRLEREVCSKSRPSERPGCTDLASRRGVPVEVCTNWRPGQVRQGGRATGRPAFSPGNPARFGTTQGNGRVATPCAGGSSPRHGGRRCHGQRHSISSSKRAGHRSR